MTSHNMENVLTWLCDQTRYAVNKYLVLIDEKGEDAAKQEISAVMNIHKQKCELEQALLGEVSSASDLMSLGWSTFITIVMFDEERVHMERVGETEWSLTEQETE